MENSIQGTVHTTIDSLLMYSSIAITNELVVPIQQDLIMRQSGSMDLVTEVWSHPQALAQCGSLIRKLRAVEVSYPSTAAAAEALATTERSDVAVICAGNNARRLGLSVVLENIAETYANFTRFAVVGKRDSQTKLPPSMPAQTSVCKTMVVVTPVTDSAGVLASILSVFATLGHNLCWIESRPTRVQLGTYQFILEIQSHLLLERTQRALSVLRAYGHEVHSLGCYSEHRVGNE